MGTVTIEINGRKLTARQGDKLLWAALDAGIYIPHLCAGKEIDYHPGSCRLCFVEIQGRDRPALACVEAVAPGMVVSTGSERVDRLVRTGFELIMSTHRLDCKDCPANKKCALQKIAKQRKIPLKPKRLPKLEPDWPIDDSHPEFGLNPNHCVLCGKCVRVCNDIENCRILDFSKRGALTTISTFDHTPLAQHDCSSCLRCVEVCPVGALYRK